MAITPPKITKTITATNPSSTESSNDQVKKILDGLEEAKKIKEEFISIFGLFAALLIFSSVEVKIFSQPTRFSLMLGISAFFISTLTLFVLTLHNIIHEKRVRDYRTAAFAISIVFFIVSMECFWWATHTGHLWLIFNIKV